MSAPATIVEDPLLDAITALPRKPSTREAAAFLRTWLRTRGWTEDRYGNFLRGGHDPVRYHFTDRMLQRQEKRGGEWHNLDSTPLTQAALNVAVNRAQKGGRDDLVARFEAAREARRSAATAGAAKRTREALEAAAGVLAYKEVQRDLPADVAKHIFSDGQDVAARGRLQAAASAAKERWLSLLDAGEPAPPDGDFTSADAPPLLPLIGAAYGYAWQERQDGGPYTVVLAHRGRGEASVELGAQEGGLRVDPYARSVSMARHGLDAAGDGYAAGRLSLRDGALQAVLFMVSATDRRRGAGTRLLRLWCRLMRGWGIDRWVGEAVGPEGEAFLAAMHRRDEIRIVGTQGSNAVVACTDGRG